MELIKDVKEITYKDFYNENNYFAMIDTFEVNNHKLALKVIENTAKKLSFNMTKMDNFNVFTRIFKFNDLDDAKDYAQNLISNNPLIMGVNCHLTKVHLSEDEFNSLIENNRLEYAFNSTIKEIDLNKEIDDFNQLIIKEYFLEDLIDLEYKMAKLLDFKGNNWGNIFYELELEFQMLLTKMNNVSIDNEWLSIPIYIEAGGLGSNILAKCNKNFGELEELAIERGFIL